MYIYIYIYYNIYYIILSYIIYVYILFVCNCVLMCVSDLLTRQKSIER